MTCRNFHEKIHQQYLTPTALSSFHLPFLAPLKLSAVYDGENYSYQFELHDKNRKLCLCLLPFINIKGKNCPRALTKVRDGRRTECRVVYAMPQMFYLWVSSTQASSASCQGEPEKACEIKVLVRSLCSHRRVSVLFKHFWARWTTWKTFRSLFVSGKRGRDMSVTGDNLWANNWKWL